MYNVSDPSFQYQILIQLHYYNRTVYLISDV